MLVAAVAAAYIKEKVSGVAVLRCTERSSCYAVPAPPSRASSLTRELRQLHSMDGARDV